MDNYVENKLGTGQKNPFNRPDDKPSDNRFSFADESMEKTPLNDHEKYEGYVSGTRGPNEGARVNGTLTEEEMNQGELTTGTSDQSRVPPGGRDGGVADVAPAADRMQFSNESGAVYKGQMVKGKASVTMFTDSAGLNDNTPAKPKVVDNPNVHLPTYG